MTVFKDLRVKPVPEGLQDQKGPKETQDPRGFLESEVKPVLMAPRVNPAQKAKRVVLVHLAHPDLSDHLGSQERLAYLVHLLVRFKTILIV